METVNYGAQESLENENKFYKAFAMSILIAITPAGSKPDVVRTEITNTLEFLYM